MRLVALLLCVALLAGCSRGSGSSALPISPDVAPHSENRDFGYRSLYSFEGGRDGANPVAGLTLVSGILYGATPAGGSKTGCASLGCGTAFAVTISGEEHVLHRFVGGTDGATPQAGLLDVNGTLYGTTEYGGSECTGSSGCGTLFRLSRDGAEHAIHSFGSSGDGFYPGAGLLAVGSTLYGTTTGGNGTVFVADTSGNEHVLYQFKGYPKDGADPLGTLVAINGDLYGTTRSGGTMNVGVIFKITSSGKERVIHSFDFSKNGGYPTAGLIALNGTLYGTTSAGGAGKRGTVFAVTPAGSLRVLHSFEGFPKGDGAYPLGGLIAFKGSLYGTTKGGGSHGDGIVFAVTGIARERVLYSFTVAPDGTHPYAQLATVGDRLYGTTAYGGTSGAGTVFRIAP